MSDAWDSKVRIVGYVVLVTLLTTSIIAGSAGSDSKHPFMLVMGRSGLFMGWAYVAFMAVLVNWQVWTKQSVDSGQIAVTCLILTILIVVTPAWTAAMREAQAVARNAEASKAEPQ